MTEARTIPERTNPRYRLIYPVFWMDPGVVAMTLEEKGVALYCLSGLQSNRIGFYKLSLGEASEDLGIDLSSMKKMFKRVVELMDWKYDSTARVILIPSWWTWNPSRNPNILKGNLTDLDEVPLTPLTDKFLEAGSERMSGNMKKTFRETTLKRLRKRSGNKPPTQEQEQEQDQEQEQKKDPPLFPGKPDKTYRSTKGKILKGKVLERFEAFLTAFGNRDGKADAADSWFKLKPIPDELYAEIIAGAKRYALTRVELKKNGGGVKMAQGWLTSRRWEDKLETSNPTIHQRDASEYEKAFDKEA